jgi:hypothetical protein
VLRPDDAERGQAIDEGIELRIARAQAVVQDRQLAFDLIDVEGEPSLT